MSTWRPLSSHALGPARKATRLRLNPFFGAVMTLGNEILLLYLVWNATARSNRLASTAAANTAQKMEFMSRIHCRPAQPRSHVFCFKLLCRHHVRTLSIERLAMQLRLVTSRRTFAVVHGGDGLLEREGRPAEPLAHARHGQRPARHDVEAALPRGAANARVANGAEDDVAVEVQRLVQLRRRQGFGSVLGSGPGPGSGHHTLLLVDMRLRHCQKHERCTMQPCQHPTSMRASVGLLCFCSAALAMSHLSTVSPTTKVVFGSILWNALSCTAALQQGQRMLGGRPATKRTGDC